MRRIFSMVSAFTRGLLRSARDTVEWETPASRATSLIDAGFRPGGVSVMHTFPHLIDSRQAYGLCNQSVHSFLAVFGTRVAKILDKRTEAGKYYRYLGK